MVEEDSYDGVGMAKEDDIGVDGSLDSIDNTEVDGTFTVEAKEGDNNDCPDMLDGPFILRQRLVIS